ncbi:MAG TPA: aminoacyl-tRNA hydrolase, partial [Tepidisphaeraceae bacterium]
ALGTSQYSRLRIGIDPPPPRIGQKDYVLGRYSEPQKAALKPALGRACDAAMMWMEKGINPAMNLFNAESENQNP